VRFVTNNKIFCFAALTLRQDLCEELGTISNIEIMELFLNPGLRSANLLIIEFLVDKRQDYSKFTFLSNIKILQLDYANPRDLSLIASALPSLELLDIKLTAAKLPLLECDLTSAKTLLLAGICKIYAKNIKLFTWVYFRMPGAY
jgi:hypothetical protein